MRFDEGAWSFGRSNGGYIYRGVMCKIRGAIVPCSQWHTGLDLRLLVPFLAEVCFIEKKVVFMLM
jgi:hypothetical protein